MTKEPYNKNRIRNMRDLVVGQTFWFVDLIHLSLTRVVIKELHPETNQVRIQGDAHLHFITEFGVEIEGQPHDRHADWRWLERL